MQQESEISTFKCQDKLIICANDIYKIKTFICLDIVYAKICITSNNLDILSIICITSNIISS